MPGDAVAQLHNLSSHMAFAAASKTLGGTPDTFETEADWDTSNDEPEPQAGSCKPKTRNFVGLVFGPARGLTDTGAPQPVVGASAAQWLCERLRKRYGLVPVDVTPSNMIATCGGIGAAKVLRVLNFPAGIVGVNGVMRFLVLVEPVSPDGKQQFIPPLKTISLMRQLCANMRMREFPVVCSLCRCEEDGSVVTWEGPEVPDEFSNCSSEGNGSVVTWEGSEAQVGASLSLCCVWAHASFGFSTPCGFFGQVQAASS